MGKQTLGHKASVLRGPDLGCHTGPLWLWLPHKRRSPWGQGDVPIQSLCACSRPLLWPLGHYNPMPRWPRPVSRTCADLFLGASSCGQILLPVCTPGTKEWLLVGVWMGFRSPGVPTHAIARLLAVWGLSRVRKKGPGESVGSKFKPDALIIIKGCVCV